MRKCGESDKMSEGSPCGHNKKAKEGAERVAGIIHM